MHLLLLCWFSIILLVILLLLLDGLLFYWFNVCCCLLVVFRGRFCRGLLNLRLGVRVGHLGLLILLWLRLLLLDLFYWWRVFSIFVVIVKKTGLVVCHMREIKILVN